MRCTRCNGCLSMWDVPLCPYCNYPEADTRNPEKILLDTIYTMFTETLDYINNLDEEELKNVLGIVKTLPRY